MRLLVLTDQWYPDAIGGSARVATATARLLAERGHEVTVVAPRIPGLPGTDVQNGLSLHRSLRRAWLPQTFTDALEVRRWVLTSRGQWDVVVAHQATNAVGALAARIDAPLVLVYHASAALEQRFLRRHLSLPKRLPKLALHPSLVLMERFAVRGAAAVLVLSEFSRQLVVAAHPGVADRIALVRGGVDAAAFGSLDRGSGVRARLDVPPDHSLLLTVRRLEPRMGLEQLLRAAGLLAERGVLFTLAIAGEGMLGEHLRLLADNLGIEDRVRFLGRVPDGALPGLYAAADVFVLPTVAYEGFGMATIESLASGTPVVGTPVGATPELLRPLDPSLLAASAEPAALAEAVTRLLRSGDASLRDRCTTYARERFDWHAVIGEWERAIASGLGPSAAGTNPGTSES